MEAFTNPQSITMTMEMFRNWNLKSNIFLKDLKIVDIPFLRKLNLLPFLVKILNSATQGIAIQRANTYTLRSKDYFLSTAQLYHPREFGDQQHISQATLGMESPYLQPIPEKPSSATMPGIFPLAIGLEMGLIPMPPSMKIQYCFTMI